MKISSSTRLVWGMARWPWTPLTLSEAAYPDIYERTHHNIVEISGRPAACLCQHNSQKHLSLGSARTRPVFHLSDGSHRALSISFVLVRPVYLTQVNFAHDMIRYDYRSLEPYKALITVNAKGDYGIYYTCVTDPLVASFLNLRRRLVPQPPTPPRAPTTPPAHP